MVEYHENDTEQDEAGQERAPRRRRRATFQPMPLSDADAPQPIGTEGDGVAGGLEGSGAADGTTGSGDDVAAPEEVLPPPAVPQAVPVEDDADGDGAHDAADEQGEQDVIVPAGPESTEPSDEQATDEQPTAAAPARPQLAVLFQAPPALPRYVEQPAEDDADEQGDDEDGAAGSRRRRRTRRRGSSETDAPASAGSGAATEVVTRAKPVREPITEPQKLKGSTRLEAKRQRRRDGRDAVRRRTVVTEAEFLARREAVDRVMLVRTNGDRVEIGVLEDGILAEHYVAKSQNLSLIGNVYLGRVQNVLPSMEAAFVDIGRGRNAVLYSGEVDWEAASDRLGDKGSQARRIELALKSGDQVLVQVTKDPIGHKGARLTSAISLPGRYLVYVPNGSMSGISRKLPDTERARLKKILKDALPDSAGVIVRTAAEGATEEQLTIDVQRLANQWAEIEHLVETAQAPTMLHGEPDLLVKIVRDVFNEDFSKLIVDGEEPRATIERYLQQVAPDLLDRLERWEGGTDVFSAHRVHEQIEKALDRKVWLPSGGSLVIDRTEAMTVIDVNTGKFVGSGGNLEETVTKNNLEAAEEIVRQLRLRDIGGIIVIDFIDMVLESNRDLVQRRLVECLSRDRTKHQVAEVTSLGLVQMTRKRLGVGLAESIGDGNSSLEKQEQQQQQGRRRGRGGNGNGNSGQQQQQVQPQQQKQPATHAITEGAKTALAQIAGATLTKLAEHGEHHDQQHEEQPAEPAAEQRTAEQRARERRAPERKAPERGAPEQRAPEQAPEQPAIVLDLPAEHREPQRPAKREAEGLLDAVLEALPAPKAAGQGRRRSRRVSTPTLTAGED
ncbi:Rne/Rng family ribonuclease [Amnibacterium setariae]|uniref:Ribonuclease E n=1 Tax=Amnibacterium setariae TaxID=2306585 RepID=A0A3A1TX79_9MICO|nr:Rne/Rng family ribonuclease [Amnibacterium setariae]RIX28218.1 Rne/Rng family ribonuclease [Amnibacterium setariae]